MTNQSINQFQKHITILGVFYIGGSLVSLAIATGLFLLLGGIGMIVVVEDLIAKRVLITTGTLYYVCYPLRPFQA